MSRLSKLMTKKDGRGDWRSDKRLFRQEMCAKYGVTSGRQWVRLRKWLRRQAAS